MGDKIVIVSAFQDYRTLKRASIQNVADGLIALGHDVTFLSTRSSALSDRTGDSRNFLKKRANRFETVAGVHCYLWRTPLHPFATNRRWIDALTPPLFDLYANWPNSAVDTALRAADTVIVESSVAVIYLRRIRRLNPRARIVYYATDLLDTVGAHPYVQRRLVMDMPLVDHIMVRSSKMVPAFDWSGKPIYRAEFGVDPRDFEGSSASPYPPGVHAVSVGSMLFDADVFRHGAALVPDVTFHVIGCGAAFETPANVIVYDEMPFSATLPYIRHASIGIAPYRPAPGVEYLGESSLKLAQYEMAGLPAVCPDFAVTGGAGRFGYVTGEPESFARAVRGAQTAIGKVARRQFPTWQDVAGRVVEPMKSGATRLL